MRTYILRKYVETYNNLFIKSNMIPPSSHGRGRRRHHHHLHHHRSINIPKRPLLTAHNAIISPGFVPHGSPRRAPSHPVRVSGIRPPQIRTSYARSPQACAACHGNSNRIYNLYRYISILQRELANTRTRILIPRRANQHILSRSPLASLSTPLSLSVFLQTFPREHIISYSRRATSPASK